ncbi:MAG: N-acetyl sugar amidotransferase [Bacteroidetes bacterium]|nr:N-acetyl sugar amidotransferase [Bacteroidota bacterium]
MKNPFFSIVIPTYNLASFLPDTINSILQQTFSNYEIIIIDDGSTDNTKEVLKPYIEKHSHLKYFWQENQRQGAARNNGIRKADGEYIVFFDHDDLMLADYLTILYQKINELNKPNFIAAKYEHQRNNKRFPSSLQKLKEGWYNVELFLRGDPLACHFCIKNKNTSLKLFEERREYATMEDWMFLVQNINNNKIYLINKTAVLMNEHPNQSMHNNTKVISARMLAMEWIIEKKILNNEQKKKMQGYSFFFCAIHSYLDSNRRKAFNYLFRSIKYNIPTYKTFLLFIKIIVGRKNIVQLKLFFNLLSSVFSKQEKPIKNMVAKKYQQCKRCVMDTTDAEIVFDESGYCNHCTDLIEKISKLPFNSKNSDKRLAQLIKKIKQSGKNKQYDCVLGLSGGSDSCYAAYLANQYGLRVLAVHMDNGWNTEISVNNIKNIVEKLGLSYHCHILDWDEFKDIQLAFLKASVHEIETPTDIAMQGVFHKIAAKYNIKYIISGGNYATEGILPKSWHYNAKDLKYLKSIYNKFGNKKLKTFPTFNALQEIYYKYVKGIRIIYLLNYFPYNKIDSMKILEEKLGWKYYGKKHHESTFTGFVQSYLLPEKFKIDYRLSTSSSKICSGLKTREESLHELAQKPYVSENIAEEKEYISKKLGINIEEFNAMIMLPPKTYKDYPNTQKKLEFIYKIYRMLNR